MFSTKKQWVTGTFDEREGHGALKSTVPTREEGAIGGCSPHMAYSSKDIWSLIGMEMSNVVCNLVRVLQGFCRSRVSAWKQ